MGVTEGEPQPHESPFWARIEQDPLLEKVAVLEYKDKNPNKSITVKVAPHFGSNIFSFTIGGNEIFWCDKNALVEKREQGAFTGNFVVAPIGVNREEGQQGEFEGRVLDFRDIPKPEGDAPLVHGFARLLQWKIGNIYYSKDAVTFETHVRYGRNDDGTYTPYSEKAYPYDVVQTHRHILTKDGLTVETLFENHGDTTAPVAHTLHADFSTTLSGPENTSVLVPANKHITTQDLMPVYPPQLTDVRGTDYDLTHPTSVAHLWLDDYYTDLDPAKPILYIPTTKPFRVEITASPEYQHVVIFTKAQDRFVALERQTSMPTALKAYNEGYASLANIIAVPPGEKQRMWTRYTVVHS